MLGSPPYRPIGREFSDKPNNIARIWLLHPPDEGSVLLGQSTQPPVRRGATCKGMHSIIRREYQGTY